MEKKKMCANHSSNAAPKKGNGSDSNSKRECTTYKYSNKGNGQLHEAAIISGRPVFLKYGNGEILCVDHIIEPGRIIKPPSAEEYPYEAYEFVDIQEVKLYGEKAEKECEGSLFDKAKCIVQKYNDQDAHKLILLAADIVWSYFQDKFSTTHYIGVIGDNGSGKSTGRRYFRDCRVSRGEYD